MNLTTSLLSLHPRHSIILRMKSKVLTKAYKDPRDLSAGYILDLPLTTEAHSLCGPAHLLALQQTYRESSHLRPFAFMSHSPKCSSLRHQNGSLLSFYPNFTSSEMPSPSASTKQDACHSISLSCFFLK